MQKQVNSHCEDCGDGDQVRKGIQQCFKKPGGFTMSTFQLRNLITVAAIAIIVGSYWVMAEPPNPWIFAVGAAGILVSVGINYAKNRAGHFK